jgi:CRISPR-associated protein (Cas_Cas02710)
MSKYSQKDKRYVGVFEIFANPEKAPIAYFFLAFFLIGPALGIAVNGLSTILFGPFCQFLVAQFGHDELFWQLIVVALSVAAVFGLIMVFNIPALLAKLRDRLFGEPALDVKPLQDTFQGLITLASPTRKNEAGNFQETPTEASIRYHLKTLEHCWIVATERALPEVNRIIQKLIGEGLITQQRAEAIFHYGPNHTLKLVERPYQPIEFLLSDRDSDNPNQVRKLINAIYADAREKGLTESEIITDYTGGTKSLTAGVILACATPSRRLQYISQIDEGMKEVSLFYRVEPLQKD